MEDINSLENSFKELQGYSDNQFHTIVELKKQVEQLQSENKHLKDMLEGTVPSLNILTDGLSISNEQLVCETQIALLKERAVTRELTMEETKKFQVFTTVLQELRKSGEDDSDVQVRKMSDEQLLKLLENPSNVSTS